MTTPTTDAIMALADAYAADRAAWYLEKLYGTSKSYTERLYKEMEEARAVLLAALQAPNWSDVGRLIEAANGAAARGFISGTSNWAAFVSQAMGGQAREGEAVAIKNAVGCVLEGWTLPEPVRKILETAYYAAPQPAQPSEPAQPEQSEQRLDMVAQPEQGERVDLYSLDSDTEGIRARVVHAVLGALAFGARNKNKPPADHWLSELWEAARAERDRKKFYRQDAMDLRDELNSLRELQSAHPVAQPLTDEDCTSIKEMGKHAFRALDKAASVICTIEPESDSERDNLDKLITEIHDVAMSLFTVCGLPMQEAERYFYKKQSHGIGGGR